MMRTAFRGGGIGFGYRLTPWVKRLILANASFWLLTWTGLIPRGLVIEYLGFTATEALTKPWTILTYMFVHGGFFHVFLNMLMLFFFGPPLEERWGGKEFLKYYAICGVAGALFNVGAMAFGLGTGDIPIVGASGAIYGVMLAYALNWPNSLVWIYAIFPVKVKYLVIILGAMTFFSAFGGTADGIAHFAHLGGLVVGYIYLKRGWRVQLHWEGLKKRLRKRKLRVVQGEANGDARRRRSSRSDEEARVLEAVDKLLDKIAAHGIDSLTSEERRFLDDVSRRRQQQHGIRH